MSSLVRSAFRSVGTHNGAFHADESLACAILRLINDGPFRIVRSRDPAVLDACDVVVDVGGAYDHAKLRYDHHQALARHNWLCVDYVQGHVRDAGRVFADPAELGRSRLQV